MCLADTSQRWITPSGLESHASGRDSVTVAWIARAGRHPRLQRARRVRLRPRGLPRTGVVRRPPGQRAPRELRRAPARSSGRPHRARPARSRRRAGKAPARRRAIRGPGSRAPAATRGRPRPGQCLALGAAKWSDRSSLPHAARIEPLEDAAARSGRRGSIGPSSALRLASAALQPSSPRTPDSGRISLIKRSPAVGGCEGKLTDEAHVDDPHDPVVCCRVGVVRARRAGLVLQDQGRQKAGRMTQEPGPAGRG